MISHLLTLAVLPLAAITIVNFYELYKLTSTLATISSQLSSSFKLHKDYIEARLYGIENVNMKALDCRITDLYIEISNLKEKINKLQEK